MRRRATHHVFIESLHLSSAESDSASAESIAAATVVSLSGARTALALVLIKQSSRDVLRSMLTIEGLAASIMILEPEMRIPVTVIYLTYNIIII